MLSETYSVAHSAARHSSQGELQLQLSGLHLSRSMSAAAECIDLTSEMVPNKRQRLAEGMPFMRCHGLLAAPACILNTQGLFMHCDVSTALQQLPNPQRPVVRKKILSHHAQVVIGAILQAWVPTSQRTQNPTKPSHLRRRTSGCMSLGRFVYPAR